MIISCPKCETKFNVPDSAITAEGRKVKCSSCDESWIQKLEAAQDEAPEQAYVEPVMESSPEQDLDNSSRRAAIRASSTGKKIAEYPSISWYDISYVRWFLGAVTACGIVFLIGVELLVNRPAIISAVPFMKDAYESLHLHDSDGVKFELIDCTVSEIKSSKNDDDSVELDVKVVMKNVASNPQLLDSLRFSMLSKDKEFLGDYTIQYDKMIAPSEAETVEGRLNRIPREAMFVIIEIGNYSEIIMRDPSIIANS